MPRKARIIRGLRLNLAELFSPVDKGAAGNAQHRPAIVLVKRASLAKGFPMPKLPEPAAAILAGLPDDKRAIMEMAIAMVAQGGGAPPAPEPAPAPEPKQDEPKPPVPGGGSAPLEPKQGDDPEGDDMTKRDEAVTTLQKSLDDARKVNEELKKRLDSLEDQRSTQTWLEKARSVAPKGIPGMTVEQVGELMKANSATLEKESFERFQKSIASSARMLEHSELLREYGAAGDGATDDSPTAQLAKRAQELAEREGISTVQAEARIMKTDKSLAKRIRDEELRISRE